MKIKLLRATRVRGAHVEPGPMDVAPEDARRLIRQGVAEDSEVQVDPIDEILDAVDALGDNDWTGQGEPRLESLEQLLGWKPSRKQVTKALSAAKEH